MSNCIFFKLCKKILLAQFFLVLFVLPAKSQASFRTNNVPQSNFLPNSSNLSIESGVDCPVPTINATGFTGSSNDFANERLNPINASTSGLDNYGFSIGLNIPLNGQLGRYCEEYAHEKKRFEERRVENQKINAQVSLINNCQYLWDLGYRFDSEAFDDENFSALKPCRALSNVFRNRRPPNIPPETEPPETSEKGESPFNPKPMRIQIDNSNGLFQP